MAGEQPEEGDLVVLARFSNVVWVVERVEHASAVALVTLDAQPHELAERFPGAGKPGVDKHPGVATGPGYWLEYDGTEESLRRAEEALAEERTLLPADDFFAWTIGGGKGGDNSEEE